MHFIMLVVAIIIIEMIVLYVANRIDKQMAKRDKFKIISLTMVTPEEEYFNKIDNPEYIHELQEYAKARQAQ